MGKKHAEIIISYLETLSLEALRKMECVGKLRNFIISHYGTSSRTMLKGANVLLVITYIAFPIIYFHLIFLGMVDVLIEYIFLFPPLSLFISGFLILLSLLIGIWRLLFRANELSSAFLNNAVKEIENMDVNDNEKRLKIIENISYFKDFAYFNTAPFPNLYAIPLPLRLELSLPFPLRKSKLVQASFKKRIQFISNKLDKLTPVIALSKDREELKRVADELKRFSVILWEENYLELNEAKLKRSYSFDIFDWRIIASGIVLMFIAFVKDLLLGYFQRF